jgi:hypothetical protein
MNVESSQPQAFHRRRVEFANKRVHTNVESGLSEPVWIITPVDPNMIWVPKQTCALVGVSDGWVFERTLPIVVKRDEQDRPGTGSQNPVELTHRSAIFSDVLEYVAANDNIERGVGNFGHVGQVKLALNPLPVEIR